MCIELIRQTTCFTMPLLSHLGCSSSWDHWPNYYHYRLQGRLQYPSFFIFHFFLTAHRYFVLIDCLDYVTTLIQFLSSLSCTALFYSPFTFYDSSSAALVAMRSSEKGHWLIRSLRLRPKHLHAVLSLIMSQKKSPLFLPSDSNPLLLVSMLCSSSHIRIFLFPLTTLLTCLLLSQPLPGRK